jgi:predicted dinucleotide-binding enzyme
VLVLQFFIGGTGSLGTALAVDLNEAAAKLQI